MSDILHEIKSIRRQLADLRNLLQENEMVNDLVNRKQAIEITGLAPTSFSNYLGKGYFTVVTENEAGQQFFSRRQLTGFDEIRK